MSQPSTPRCSRVTVLTLLFARSVLSPFHPCMERSRSGPPGPVFPTSYIFSSSWITSFLSFALSAKFLKKPTTLFPLLNSYLLLTPLNAHQKDSFNALLVFSFSFTTFSFSSRPQANKHLLICMPKGDISSDMHFSS